MIQILSFGAFEKGKMSAGNYVQQGRAH